MRIEVEDLILGPDSLNPAPQDVDDEIDEHDPHTISHPKHQA